MKRKLFGGLGMLVAMLVGGGELLLSSGSATAQSQGATQRVIVVMKNQESGLPATKSLIARRRNAVHQIQSPVSRQMSRAGARNIHAYTVINALSAVVSPSEESSLKSNPAVSKVVPDEVIRLAPAQAGGRSASEGGTPDTTVCAPNGQVQLNPQALETIHADSDVSGAQTARSLGFTGAGVTVAFIADGLDINNPDFTRANGSHVFTDYKDFSGEGTNVPTGGEEAFGDAASIAAQGRTIYNVANYGPHAVSTACNIRIEGVAPGANLVGLDIFGAGDAGYNSSFLQAIDYAVSVDHVNVLNESLGNNYYPDEQASLDVIKQANDNAVAAGTAVTVSSGDAGVTGTIGTPSTDPNVLSMGATTTYRSDLQDGYGGAQFPGIKGYLNNDISSFSSGGFEQDGRTIDAVAPGELNWSLCSTDTAMYRDCVSYGGNATPVIPFGGTSESSPLTAGEAALVIQAYRQGHGGASPAPAVVKQIIDSTTDDIGSPADQQGAGLIDAYKAVLAAESYRTPTSAGTPAGQTVLASATQLNAVGPPGMSERLTDTITNSGTSTQTISLSTRKLGTYTTVKTAKVTLSDANSPKTTNWAGTPANYEPVTFSVPAGEDRLSVSLAFQNALTGYDFGYLNARVRLTLVDPSGNLAAYSVPQGDGNYGNVQVTNPKPGTWTGYIWSNTSADGGTEGPVLLAAAVAKYTSFGSITPRSVTLAPGASRQATLTVTTPATPGDAAGAIVLNSNAGPAFGQQSTIPVTLRSLIPTGPQSFTQTLTGGNGRATFTGQEFYYQLDATAGLPELNASVVLANNPNNPFTALLISPGGEALAEAANALPSSTAPGYTNQLGAQLHVLSPAQGTWTLIIAFAPQVSGTAVTEPFTVSTSESRVRASAGGLPNSNATTLAKGQAQSYNIRITNNGASPEAYFLDGRLPGSTPLSLTSLSASDTTVPLNSSQNVPLYFIPSHSTAFTGVASTTGSTPIQFDAGAPLGDPDVASTVGTQVSASFAGDPITQGLWGIVPTVVGPFGTTGAPTEPVHTTMNVATAPFDPAVSSQTGDLWSVSTDPSQLTGFSPVIVGPGQTGTIPVTITPSGPSGTHVSGTLYVDDTNEFAFQGFYQPSGNDVAAIPYSYTVK
ncbi:MAG: protease inhibitor I9 family protein [Solirubrobacterales bacterium]|nr:protease inhibitor I9 family protein [Solirubrobacterales bacterium]MBV9714974.1 protease inhibitor I9 family protein [Solirubrobacterales bacterium]